MTACKHGHELTPENIVIRHGKERCRTCEHINGATYRAKRKAESTPVVDPSPVADAEGAA